MVRRIGIGNEAWHPELLGGEEDWFTHSTMVLCCSTEPRRQGGVSPLIPMALCPDKPILTGLSGSFAPCSVAALAGYYDEESVISLWQRVVNVMQSGMEGSVSKNG